MILKLGMEPYVCKLHKVNVKDDSELTMTYFTVMSNLVKLVFYAPNFEKVGDILVSAFPFVCVCVCM